VTNKQEALEAVLMRVRRIEARGVTGVSGRRVQVLQEMLKETQDAHAWIGRRALGVEGLPLPLSESLASIAAGALHLLIDEPDSVGGRTLAEWLDGVDAGNADG
jgi:hypothetical protein